MMLAAKKKVDKLRSYWDSCTTGEAEKTLSDVPVKRGRGRPKGSGRKKGQAKSKARSQKKGKTQKKTKAVKQTRVNEERTG